MSRPIEFPSFFRKAFYTHQIISWIILLFSVVLALFVWSVSKDYYDTRSKEYFQNNVNENIDRINKRMIKYENALRSGIALFHANESVSRHEWHQFIKALQAEKYYPGFQGIGFSLMVRPEEVAPLEHKMRAEGYTQFALKPAGKREQYSAILYLEPMNKRNVQAIGYDMFSQPTRREAMEKARDTGLASVSGRVILVQEIDSNVQAGFLMYLPLYKTETRADTIESRRNAILGFVYSPFRMKDLMNEIGPNDSLLNFEIYDNKAISDDYLLYRSFKPSSYVSKYNSQQTLQVGGRTWHIHFSTTPEFDSSTDSYYPLLLTLGGLLIYFILLFIILTLLKNRRILKLKTKEIESSRSWLNTILESSIDGIHITDLDGRLIEYSPSFLKMLGYDKEEALHLSIDVWEAQHSHEEINKIFHSMPDTPLTIETLHRRKNGTVFTAEITTKAITLDGQRYIYASSRDITKRKEAERELLKLSQAVEQNPNTIVITDLEGNIEYVNNAFVTVTGYTKEEAVGKNPRLLKSGKTQTSTYDDMWEHLIQRKSWKGEFTNRRKDGTEYTEEIISAPIFEADGNITHYMAIKKDITEEKRAEERIHYLANFDVLTGLPNRITLEERTTYAITLAHRQESTLALLFLDLDHFKDINDTLGHSIGDLLLIELGKRFASVLREADTVSRLGGDEFIFMIPQTDTEGVTHVAKKLLNIISEPVIIESNELIVTASIGIAMYPVDGKNYETLAKNADTAMYRAKQEGRNRYAFFTEAMQQRSARNLQLTNALHHALKRNQFHLVYQPQISTHDSRIIGAEALLRWTHPEFGNISPFEFIPLAEESGLILPIGEWVLRSAVKQAKEWIEHGLSPMIVAVNISAVQFRHPRLPELVTNILENTGLKPEYLELELTEAAAMYDPKIASNVMTKLHDLGVRMAIDDFGTGYSSLNYLKKFKVYKLKIDKSFVHDIYTDPEDKAIVNAIIKMSHSLGLKTIAEGVETLEQLNYLREQGCDEIQGYYYSKPLSVKEFEIFVRKEKKL
ncbi:MAG: EAL domain-containing protein [Sulfurovum sp.]|nr:EAL domain-containing protein [Sulfurovum sp.]